MIRCLRNIQYRHGIGVGIYRVNYFLRITVLFFFNCLETENVFAANIRKNIQLVIGK